MLWQTCHEDPRSPPSSRQDKENVHMSSTSGRQFPLQHDFTLRTIHCFVHPLPAQSFSDTSVPAPSKVTSRKPAQPPVLAEHIPAKTAASEPCSKHTSPHPSTEDRGATAEGALASQEQSEQDRATLMPRAEKRREQTLPALPLLPEA